MRRLVKYIASKSLRPALQRYLLVTRRYRYGNITLQVPPSVFHPGFFSSTKLLLRYLCTLPLQGKGVLELGAGSGLISIRLAQLGAMVTATDINETALAQLHHNAMVNKVELDIRRSDLFADLGAASFDLIAINPPYYRGSARTERELAWYCGPEGEYFARLFQQLGAHVHAGSEVCMVLCDGCDLDMIRRHAAAGGFRLQCVEEQRNLLETNYIFRIQKTGTYA